MSTVCIIGAGELGGAVAHALARGERVRRVIIIDDAAGVAAGKALDIQQAGAIDGCSHPSRGKRRPLSRRRRGRLHRRRSKRPHLERMAGRRGAHDVEAARRRTSATPQSCSPARPRRTCSWPPRAKLHIRRERLSGPHRRRSPGAVKVDGGARSAVLADARSDSTVLGAPPRGFVVPWSEASIGGHALERVLTQVQLSRIESRVAHLWPPGPHALGLAAARVAEALAIVLAPHLQRAHRARRRIRRPRPGRRAAGDPVQSGHRRPTRVPALNTRERVQVENALG